MTPLFQGEVQLRRWSESSTQGVQVTFALADSDDLEPLKMKSGRRFACVLVEIGDDEKPVEPPKEPIGPLCNWLVIRCKEPEFWAWINSETHGGVMWHVKNELEAKEFVREYIGIKSRRELDTDPVKKANFDNLIRYPFQHWLVRRGG